MARKKFILVAQVSSERPEAIKPVLEKFARGGSVEQSPEGFTVKVTASGESARALNKELLSALRRIERKTRLRAQWTSGHTTERFFDYVPKGKTESP